MGRALKRPTVSEVLSGRVSPSIGQLFALIREVNPTDRELPQEEARARYFTKARLIEVLLARYGDELLIEPEGDGEVIGVQRRLHPADATHLLLSELDEEWRSWVRRRLDEDQASAEVASQLAPPRIATISEPAQSLLAQGQAALADYDFEAAEAFWRRAIEEEQDLEACRALFTLWVEQLGRDEDACALASELEAQLLADPTVRGLMALATARLSKVEEARAWLSGPPIDALRYADVLAALVQAGLTTSLAEAESDLHKLRALAPGHVALEALTRDLARARAEARRPLELELEAAIARGDWGEIEAKAQAIKGQWPDSELAGRALARVARQRGEAAVASLRQDIEAAKVAGELSKVVEGLRRLKGLAPGLQVEDELAAAIARAREQETQGAVSSLRAALARGVTGQTLAAFLELPDSARAEVLAATSTPELLWLEAFEAGRAKLDPAEEIGLALLATQAERLLEQAQPEQALKQLLPQERRLAGISRGRGLLEGCRRQVQQALAERTSRALAEVEGALAEGRSEEAFSRLEAIEPEHLDIEAKPRWERVRAQVDHRLALAGQHRALLEAQSSGAHLEAKRAIDRLMELDDPANRALHLATRAQADVEVNRSWCLSDLPADSADEEPVDLRDVVLHPLGEAPKCSVAPDPNTVLWVEARGRLVFVRTVDAQRGQVTRTVIFRTPKALGDLSLRLEGELLWMAGAKKGLLAYAWRRAEIVDWWDLSKHLEPGESGGRLEVLAGGRFALFGGDVPGEARTRLRIIDLERDREHRSLGTETNGHRVLPSTQEARLALLHLEGGVSLHAASGNVLQGGTLPVDEPLEVVVSPDGRGFVLLQQLPSTNDPQETGIWVRRMSNQGQLGPALELPGSGPELIHTLAGARETGWVYLYFRGLSEDPAELKGKLLERMVPQLAALAPTGEGYELRWRIRVPEATYLLTDADERAVWVGFGGHQGATFERLGLNPPTPPQGGPHRARWRSSTIACTPPFLEETKAWVTDWNASQDPAVIGPAGLGAKHQKEPAILAHLIRNPSAMKGSDPKVLREILLEQYPDHPATCLLLADEQAHQREWRAAAEILLRTNFDVPYEGRRQHRLHLVAELHLQFGDLEAARATLDEAVASAAGRSTDCELEALGAILDATERLVKGTAAPADDWLGQLLETIRATDQALAKDDNLEALRLIDTPAVWHARELQSAARRTLIYLRLTSRDSGFRFRKATALSAFIELMEARSPFATFSLPLYQATWEGKYLRHLEEGARKWIDSGGWT